MFMNNIERLWKKKHREKYLYYKKRGKLAEYYASKPKKEPEIQLPKPIVKPIIKPKKLTFWQKLWKFINK